PFLTLDKRSHLFSVSRFPHSLTTRKLVASFAHFVSFKRFLLSVYSSSNWKLSSLLIQKKRPLGLGSSHPIYLPGNVLLLRNVSPTTIGAKELNFCVRHGNRCDLLAIVTRQCHV